MACSGPQNRNGNYSLVWVTLAMVIICVLTIAGPSLNRYFQSMNNEVAAGDTLQEFAAAFQNLQHPADTEPVASRNFVGEFAGGGQGCDFFAGQIRSYPDNQDAIPGAYSHQETGSESIQVLFLENGQIPDPAGFALPETLNKTAEWELPADAQQLQLYLVYGLLLDYGDFDCR